MADLSKLAQSLTHLSAGFGAGLRSGEQIAITRKRQAEQDERARKRFVVDSATSMVDLLGKSGVQLDAKTVELMARNIAEQAGLPLDIGIEERFDFLDLQQAQLKQRELERQERIKKSASEQSLTKRKTALEEEKLKFEREKFKKEQEQVKEREPNLGQLAKDLQGELKGITNKFGEAQEGSEERFKELKKQIGQINRIRMIKSGARKPKNADEIVGWVANQLITEDEALKIAAKNKIKF
jgi:hypothetical protein